jgi:hypothetical protein
METDEAEWRFQWIVDPKSLKPLFQIEHEVRSMKPPVRPPAGEPQPRHHQHDVRRGAGRLPRYLLS